MTFAGEESKYRSGLVHTWLRTFVPSVWSLIAKRLYSDSYSKVTRASSSDDGQKPNSLVAKRRPFQAFESCVSKLYVLIATVEPVDIV